MVVKTMILPERHAQRVVVQYFPPSPASNEVAGVLRTEGTARSAWRASLERSQLVSLGNNSVLIFYIYIHVYKHLPLIIALLIVPPIPSLLTKHWVKKITSDIVIQPLTTSQF